MKKELDITMENRITKEQFYEINQSFAESLKENVVERIASFIGFKFKLVKISYYTSFS